MGTDFLKFGKGSTRVEREPGDPDCFALAWDPDEPDCKHECTAYARCGRETARLDTIAKHKRTNTRALTSQSKTTNGKLGTYSSGSGQSLIRPKTPPDMPPGTEYLPPSAAGKSTAFERGVAIAMSEGVAAFGVQACHSLADFIRDITAWHPNAGEWKYGDNFTRRDPRKR